MAGEKFTPGPWTLMASNPERDGADCWTLLAQPHPGLRGFTKELAILAGPQSDENAQANAALIKAAPALYEALKGLTDAYVALLLIKGEDPSRFKEPGSPYANALAALSQANLEGK